MAAFTIKMLHEKFNSDIRLCKTEEEKKCFHIVQGVYLREYAAELSKARPLTPVESRIVQQFM